MLSHSKCSVTAKIGFATTLQGHTVTGFPGAIHHPHNTSPDTLWKCSHPRFMNMNPIAGLGHISCMTMTRLHSIDISIRLVKIKLRFILTGFRPTIYCIEIKSEFGSDGLLRRGKARVLQGASKKFNQQKYWDITVPLPWS